MPKDIILPAPGRPDDEVVIMPPDPQYPEPGDIGNFFTGMIIGFTIGFAIGGAFAAIVFHV